MAPDLPNDPRHALHASVVPVNEAPIYIPSPEEDSTLLRDLRNLMMRTGRGQASGTDPIELARVMRDALVAYERAKRGRAHAPAS